MVLLPHAPSSVGAARHMLGTDLRAHGVADVAVADAILVLSELMSNAVRHASPLPGAQIRVAWTMAPGRLEIAVTDGGGATQPHPGRPSPATVGGRGLSIVERLSRCWGVRTGEHGTTVWAVLPATPAGRVPRRSGHVPAGARPGQDVA